MANSITATALSDLGPLVLGASAPASCGDTVRGPPEPVSTRACFFACCVLCIALRTLEIGQRKASATKSEQTEGLAGSF